MKVTTPDSSYDSAVLIEQTRALYGSLNLALIATVINSAVLFFVLNAVIPENPLLIWMTVLYVLCFVRWLLGMRYNRLDTKGREDLKWYRFFTIGACFSGLVWGSAAIWLYPAEGIANQIFFTFVLGGMAAGSLTSLAYERIVSIVFLTLLMVPLVVRVVISQEQLSVVMGLMLAYFLLNFLVAATRISNNTRQNIFYEMELSRKQKRIEQSEQYNQVLLKSVSDAFFLHDLNGRIIDVNRHACDSLGYTREELLGMAMPDIEKGASREFLNEFWPTLKKAGKLELECIHQCKNGETFPVDVHLGPVEIGDQSYVLALVRDITVHKKALEASNEAKLAAERLSESKSRFLSHMSHELRTPLNAIMGFTQILQFNNSNFTEQQNTQLNEIFKSSQYLLEMITEILDLSAIESGKIEMNFQQINFSDILSETVVLVSGLADKYQVTIVNQSEDADFCIWADRKRVKQVLLNLLSNGIKYNRHPGELRVKYWQLDDNLMRVMVSDDGDGMSKDEAAKLFRPFERRDNNPTIEGTGIGLVMTKRLIAEMGGSLDFNTVKGKGSDFWLDFVLSKDAPKE
ncbi:MAG: ATP-binding protein [Aestuariibacter sp.]